MGPTARDGAIVLDELDGIEDLPAGWTDRQEAASYRLERRDDDALFGYVVGPHSFKRYLHPPRVKLWQVRRRDDGMEFSRGGAAAPRYAFLGVRACDLAAMRVQDRVMIGQDARDPIYAERREGAFLISVHCTEARSTCFCASMGAGPVADAGFDLALTEVLGERDGEPRHEFVITAGTPRGQEALRRLPSRPAGARELEAARAGHERARAQMGRRLETEGVRALLRDNPESPQWDDVATRCLSCGNCTLVCPTCFCSTVEDTVDLKGEHAERWRSWDSCFTGEFSYIHGGVVRPSTRARYRQWLTHKLSTWFDQFGTSGCVGCGRCVTWCPVGIDLRAEVAAIRRRADADEPARATSSTPDAGSDA